MRESFSRTLRWPSPLGRGAARARLLPFLAAAVIAWFLPSVVHGVSEPFSASAPPSIPRFRREMPRTVRADHPAILPVAEAIRALTTDPLKQLVIVNDAAHLLVDYDDDERVYGRVEYHATLDEMLAQRRRHGWLYLRDDCDGRAVFAAHLLAALGIPWKLEASRWKQHAWVVAHVDGVDYDLLDLRADAPELARLSYRFLGRWLTHPARRPPPFNWRAQWAAHPDFTVGLRLGLLTVDSTPQHFQERSSTDWVKRSPSDLRSPLDERTLSAVCAGFPFGEPLYPEGLAHRTASVEIAATPNTGPGSSLITAHPQSSGAHTAATATSDTEPERPPPTVLRDPHGRRM